MSKLSNKYKQLQHDRHRKNRTLSPVQPTEPQITKHIPVKNMTLVQLQNLTPDQLLNLSVSDYQYRATTIQSTKSTTFKPQYCLCQDCLKTYLYSDDRHNEKELCSCGGQLCGCESCSNKATLIRKKLSHQNQFDFATLHKKT